MLKALALASKKMPWDKYCSNLGEYFDAISQKRDRQEKGDCKSVVDTPLEKRVDDYLSRGIYLTSPTVPGFLNKNDPDIPSLFFASGHFEILNAPRACVLNSRKPRLIHPQDVWLKATLRLADKLMEEGFSIVSSTRTTGYDIVSYKAYKNAHPLILVLDHPLPAMLPASCREQFTNQYGYLLKRDRTLLVSPFPSDTVLSRRKRMVLRDKIITRLSECIAVAAIRESGNMFHLVNEAADQGRHVRVFYPPGFSAHMRGNRKILEIHGKKIRCVRDDESESRDFRKTKRSPQAYGQRAKIVERFPENYLTHFTRRCPGPWPGQTYLEYLDSLVENASGAHHSAFETLKRILREGRIRACGKMYRGGEPVISFTECSPEEILEITTWNPALIRWTFEPYGIAFPKNYLIHAGARPVIYASDSEYEEIAENERYLFQLHDPPRKRWKQEREWRIRGDLLIHRFNPEELIVVVKKPEEAQEISDMFSHRVFVLHR